jgi:hypothetical protein
VNSSTCTRADLRVSHGDAALRAHPQPIIAAAPEARRLGSATAAMLAASARPRLSCACVMQARRDRATRQDDARRSRRVPLNGPLTNRRAWSQPPNDLPGQGGPLSTCQPPWQHLGARNHGHRCRLTTALLIPATASGPLSVAQSLHTGLGSTLCQRWVDCARRASTAGRWLAQRGQDACLLSLAPAVLVAMTGADSSTKRGSNGREKAVKEEPKDSRDSGESHQKTHQKIH